MYKIACIVLLMVLTAAGGGGLGLDTARITPLTTYPGIETHPSFSPDGTRLAFVWGGETDDNKDIYVIRLGAGAPSRLTSDPALDRGPVWSPDGKWIAFCRSSREGRNSVLVVPSAGGVERKLIDLGVREVWTGLSWSPDGKWLVAGEMVFEDSSGIFLISSGQGERRKLVSRSAPSYTACPVFSPDGRFLAFVTGASAGAEDIYLLQLNKDYSAIGEPKRLTHHGGFIRGISWAPDKQTLVYSHSADSDAWLWRVPAFSGAEPERLDFAGPRATWPTVASHGNRLVYRRGDQDFDLWRVDAGEAPKPTLFTERWDIHPRFSSDGRRLTFSSRREGGESAIWVSNADGTSPHRITSASGQTQGYPCWSPDGCSIVFTASGEGGAPDVFVVDAAGGKIRQLTSHPAHDEQPNWSRDGQWIYFHSDRSGRWEIMRIPAGGGEAVQVTENGGYQPVESPDGRTLYYLRPGLSATVPLLARPVGLGPERQVLESVRWCFSVVKGGIYYLAADGEDGSLPLRYYDLTSGKNRLVTGLKGRAIEYLTASPDGKTVLFSAESPWRIDLMLVENFR
jgi:Tol biopolymer transport system component